MTNGVMSHRRRLILLTGLAAASWLMLASVVDETMRLANRLAFSISQNTPPTLYSAGSPTC